MPIVPEESEEVTEPTPEEEEFEPVVVNPGYEGVTVDTARHDVSSMLAYIEGSPWTVHYYSQMLGPDSETRPLQLDLDPAYQQYTCIKDMEIRVESELDFSMSQDTGGMSATGTALTYPRMIPNQGDMFIATIGDGRQGVLVVTNVERLTIYKETCHRIEYQAVKYLDDEYQQNFDNKTVRTVYFRRDLLRVGQNPFLVKSQVETVESLHDSQTKLIGTYIKEFLDADQKTFLVPGGDKTLYDHFLVKAFRSVFNVNDHQLMREVLAKNCDGDEMMSEHTFWDCLLDMDDTLLPLLVKVMKTVPAYKFQALPVFRGIAYSGIDEILYPDTEADVGSMSAVSTQPLVHPPHHGGTYVFSPAFYNNEDGKSVLEVETLKGIRGESFDKENLKQLVVESYEWPAEYRFFYVPVLLILIKSAERRL